MKQSMKELLLIAALTMTAARAAFNSPIQPGTSGVLPPDQREPAGARTRPVRRKHQGTRRIAREAADAEPRVHGEYQFIGNPAVFLVAGDRDGDTLEIEESNDGTHITGNWVGKFAAGRHSMSDERMDTDDSNAQPFDLRPAIAGRILPPMRSGNAKPPAAPSLEPAPRNGVDGTSNVIIGE